MVEVSAKISKDEINALPLKAYEGPIHLVNTDEKVAEAIKNLREDTVLGFDTESRPSFRKGDSYPVSLLQLATGTDVYLFQIQLISDLQPIFDLLSDPQIIKAGVAITDDVKKLQDLQTFKADGFMEIATLAQQSGLINTGLRSLAALLLQFRISKGAQVSNWAKADLTDAQIQYAATDAWVSRMLYMRFDRVCVKAIPVVDSAHSVN